LYTLNKLIKLKTPYIVEVWHWMGCIRIKWRRKWD